MEKYYYIVDTEAPADDSVVKFEDGRTMCSLEEAETFLAANQQDLTTPIVLEDGVEILKRFTMFEIKEVTE